MSDIVIRAENLSKRYLLGRRIGYKTLRETLVNAVKDPFFFRPPRESVWALKDVSFEVKKGEVLGIIGRNGAGKSTLLKILSRITEPTSGSAELRGRVGSLLEVGTGFHPELTGRENVYLYGAVLGMSSTEISRKYREIIEFAELERFIDTPVKRYSSGMYMRLAFSVAAYLEPEILLVDEVLAVGDSAFQKKCLGKMNEVSGGGRTVLFVSHNLAAVEALCSRALILSEGKILFIGKTSDAVSRYLSMGLDTSGRLSLVERKDRQGQGNVRITSVEMKASNGLVTGGEVAVLINYKSLSGVKIKEFGMSIWTDREVRLVSLSTEFMGDIRDIPAEGAISCHIPELILVRGRYLLNVFVSSNNGLEDYLVNAMSFNVDDSNFYGTGKSVDPNWGAIAVRHKWGLLK